MAEDEHARAEALALLMVCPESCDEVAGDALLQLVGGEVPSFCGLLPLLARSPEGVLPALLRRAEAHPEETQDILLVLRNEALSPEHEDAVLALAEDAYGRGRVAEFAFGMIVEYRL